MALSLQLLPGHLWNHPDPEIPEKVFVCFANCLTDYETKECVFTG